MIPHNQKATDEQIKEAYARTKSVWKAAKLLNMCGQSVHARFKKMKIDISQNIFTPEEDELINRVYDLYRDAGKLSELALRMNRRKTTICVHAKKLGLTDRNRKALWQGHWKYMRKEEAEILFEKLKMSNLGIGQFCRKFGLANLGFSTTMKRFFPGQWDAVVEIKKTKQTMYRLGRSVEYAVRDDFIKNGYYALRSPRSGGPADIIAIKKGLVVFIQCKRSMNCRVGEWNKIYDLAVSVDGIALIGGRPTGRGLIYWLIIGRKDGSRRAQPKQNINLDELEALRGLRL